MRKSGLDNIAFISSSQCTLPGHRSRLRCGNVAVELSHGTELSRLSEKPHEAWEKMMPT